METPELKLIRKVHGIFKSKNLRLSLAESCTAGFISSLVAHLPGASDFFDSAVVCYSPESKEKLLGVKKAILRRHGTVSEEAAMAMAEGVRLRTKTDFALSITGNLGPKPIEDKEAGLVFIAISFEGGVESKGMMFEGSRDEIKLAASAAALEFLYGVVSIWG
ncbi:MAG: CinA family protein [Thermodesulfovibrionales bacterium]|nr:CinA family protein [Thermodesulfovibrionales bacterium]